MTTPEKDAMTPDDINNGSDSSFNPSSSSSTVAEGQAASASDGAEAEASENLVDELIAEVEAEAQEPSLEEQLAQAKAEINELNEKYLRLHAEWDTYRRRMAEEKQEAKKQANEKLVSELLPVIDDFERTIDYASNNGEKGLLDGVRAVYSKVMDTMKKSNVEVINPIGEAFDSLEAQAVQMIEDPSVPDETVSQVFQKGYKMGVKVLRPAMVIVATGGPRREKTEEE